MTRLVMGINKNTPDIRLWDPREFGVFGITEAIMMSNKHITKYLRSYFSLPEPAYAVMLSGEWGCGKAWFMNHVMDEHARSVAEQANKLFLYISLYGMQEVSEINATIYRAVHPTLAKAGTAVKNFLSAITITGPWPIG